VISSTENITPRSLVRTIYNARESEETIEQAKEKEVATLRYVTKESEFGFEKVAKMAQVVKHEKENLVVLKMKMIL